MFVPKKRYIRDFNEDIIFFISGNIIPFVHSVYVESIIDNKITYMYGYNLPSVFVYLFMYPFVYLWNWVCEIPNMSIKECFITLFQIYKIYEYEPKYNKKNKIFNFGENFYITMRRLLNEQ